MNDYTIVRRDKDLLNSQNRAKRRTQETRTNI